jgi:enoyl-CoA hydratase/carnithine racemase
MSTPSSTVSRQGDPALLTVDGPIATITLNRPDAFNSINLAIAQKLDF